MGAAPGKLGSPLRNDPRSSNSVVKEREWAATESVFLCSIVTHRRPSQMSQAVHYRPHRCEHLVRQIETRLIETGVPAAG